MDYVYRQRLVDLQSLGFSDYGEYLASPLWNLIRREILFRDCKGCRRAKCPNHFKEVEKQVHHLSYTKGCLLGLQPACLITLCKDCHSFVEHDDKGEKLGYFMDVIRKTIGEVSNRPAIWQKPKYNQNKVGFWFKQQAQSNQEVARNILTKLKSSLPVWYAQAVSLAYEGRLGRGVAKYLGITKQVYEEVGT